MRPDNTRESPMNRRLFLPQTEHGTAATLPARVSTPAASRPGPGMLSGRNRQAGFTIVEVMVAVIVFSVGLAAICGMQTRSMQQSTFSDQMSMRVNELTHWAEALIRLPVMDETIGIDGGNQVDVTTSDVFKEDNTCAYKTSCAWTYIEYEGNRPQRLRQRITRGYPLPNLVMVELEAIPRGVTSKIAERRTVRGAFVRSLRWN